MLQHYETFATEVAGLPQFVKDEFDAYLECGILAHGFLRLRCEGCTRDTLVAFFRDFPLELHQDAWMGVNVAGKSKDFDASHRPCIHVLCCIARARF